MGRRNNTGLTRKAGVHKNDPHQYEGAQPMDRPTCYNKLPLGGLYPQNLVMSKPAWYLVEGCADPDRAKHPTGRWTTKQKAKEHHLKDHAFDVLDDTGRQMFRIVCRSNTPNSISRGDGSFFVVSSENEDIAPPAAVAGSYQAFAPIAMNQLVQYFQPAQVQRPPFFLVQAPQSVAQPFQQFRVPQAQFSPAQNNHSVIHMAQSPAPFAQLAIAKGYQQMDFDMDMRLIGDDGAGLDLGTYDNPIDLSALDPYNQPDQDLNNNAFGLGLGLGNMAISPQTTSHNNDLDLGMSTAGYNAQINDGDFGLGVSCLNSRQQADAVHHNNLSLDQQPSLAKGNGLGLAMGKFDLPDQAINHSNLSAGMNNMDLSQQFLSDLNEFDFNNMDVNLGPMDGFDQRAAGFIGNSAQPAGASFNNGTNIDQIPLTADNFDFDGSVINESAVLAALSIDAPINFTAEDIAAVNQLPGIGGDPDKEAARQAEHLARHEAALQAEFFSSQEDEKDDFEAEMEKGFNLLNSIHTVGKGSVEPASSPADGRLNFSDAGVVASPTSNDMHQGAGHTDVNFDELFGDESSTFLEDNLRRVSWIGFCHCCPSSSTS